jgi:hypothetical protein
MQCQLYVCIIDVIFVFYIGNYDQNAIGELLSESLRTKDLSHLNVMELTGVLMQAWPH